MRLAETEVALLGRALNAKSIQLACAALQKEAKPIDDIRSTGAYRKRVAINLLTEFLTALATEGQGR
jgi:xanthine dehydrogenase iron-sulfur cluster and FAD-binding subunit A